MGDKMLKNSFGTDSVLDSSSILNRSVIEKLPYAVTGFGDFDCSPDFFTERDQYASCLLFYTLEGQGYLKYGKKEYLLPPRHAAVIDCRRYQYYAPAFESRWHFWWLHFEGKCAFDLVELLNEADLSVLDLSNRPDFPRYFQRLRELERSVDRNRELLLSNLVGEMLSEMIFYRQRRISEQKYAIYLPAIERMTAYILEHYHEELTVEWMARQCNISKYYFIRVFRCVTGDTPYTFLTLCRLKQAKRLLLDTDDTVSEIAARVGYADVKNFIASFKKNVGITPLQFRKTPKI